MIFLDEISSYVRRAQGSSFRAGLVITSAGGINTVIVPEVEGIIRDGYFEYPDVGKLLRRYMEKNNKVYLKFTAKYVLNGGMVSTGSTLDVLCAKKTEVLPSNSALTDAGDALKHRFMLGMGNLLNLNSSVVWVTPGESYTVHYCNTPNLDGWSELYKAHYRKDGSFEREERSQIREDGTVRTISLPYVSNRLRSFVSSTGGSGRILWIYYIDAPVVECFRFRNAWNVFEQVLVPSGSVEHNPSISCDLGQIGSAQMRYAVEHSKEIIVKAKHLPAFMYSNLMALCRARDVQYRERVGDYVLWRDVVITGYKLPKSSSPDSVIDLEIKFKYVDTSLNTALVWPTSYE